MVTLFAGFVNFNDLHIFGWHNVAADFVQVTALLDIWNVFGVYSYMPVYLEQRDDQQESAKDAAFAQQLEEEFDDLDEEFLREYRLKRLEELRKSYEAV